MLGKEFAYTMRDGTVVGIDVEFDPEDVMSYLPNDDEPMSWDRINEMSRNLLRYGTVDSPESDVTYQM